MTELNRKESEMTDSSSATTEQAAHRLQIEYAGSIDPIRPERAYP